MDVFNLAAKLTLDKSEYESGLDQAESSASGFGSKLSGGLSKAGKVAMGAITATAGAIAGVGAAMGSAISATAEYGDSIDKASQKIGVSASFYQEWDAVLQHSGTSMDSMSATFKKLATASQDASDDQKEAFEQLGLSMEQVSSMSTEELFTSVISGLQGMEEGTERTALATQLLGKGAMEMGALLNTSSEDTQAMIDTVNQLGGVMSDKAVKDAAAFQDSLQDLQTSFSGMKNNLTAEFLPSITAVMDGLTKLMTGDSSGLGMISKGIDEFVDNLTAMLPEVSKAGTEIVLSLGEAIISNLPTVIEAGMDVVMQLAQGLMDNLPMILQVAMQIILTIANGLAENLPTLIPAVVDVVLQITDALINNVDLLIDGAIALILGLTEGMINAMPQLIDKIPEMVLKIVEALIRNAPKLLLAALQLVLALANGLVTSWTQLLNKIPLLVEQVKRKFESFKDNWRTIGKNIVEGLWNGLKDQWGELVNNVSELAGKLVDAVKNKFGIKSPSRVFKQIGEFIVEGFEIGMKPFADGSILDGVDSALNSIAMNPVSVSASGASDFNSSNRTYSNNENINVYVTLEGDANKLFRVVQSESSKYTRLTGQSAFG